ncbi:MAG: tRNA (adenosine(37)-N6)-dimethylallyltransferase MiaA [Bacteroidia bacterium]|nr:tRNA (adenosine(37)-N6)-dimethylallyltransferase MiaA [Bacteroidia bacterium]
MTEHLNKGTLIVIAGPTAVGKTSFAIQVAQHFNTEIISCDSRQLFKELNIGVARPSEDELQTVKHHFIASHSIFEEYNAGNYETEVNSLLEKLFLKHKVVVMTGGTGLYIKAAIEGLDPLPPKNKALREELNALLNASGIEALQQKANSLNLVITKENASNPQRLIRAIEIAMQEPSTTLQNKVSRNYNTFCFYLDRDREELYRRINTRVDSMLEEGLEEEARTLHAHKDLNALQTVGYKEFFEYFDGNWSKEKCIEKIKQNTRNYAKRQLTWFRNQGNFVKINTSVEELLNHIPS